MEKIDLTNSWSNFGMKLKNEMQIDSYIPVGTEKNKARQNMKWLMIRRLLEAFIFGVFSFMLIRFSVNHTPLVHYMIAGMILGVFSLIELSGNLRIALLIYKLDYSSPVTSFQEQMEKIKTHNLQILRLAFLSIPFYFAYIILGSELLFGLDILNHADKTWLWFNLAFSILVMWPAIWLYRNLSYKTRIRWIKSMIMDNGGKQICSAFQFLDDIEQFKSDEQA